MRLPALAVACLVLAACSRPEAPDKERPLEPQSTARHDDLRRAIDAPQQRARDAQGAVDAAARNQDAAIEAAESGG